MQRDRNWTVNQRRVEERGRRRKEKRKQGEQDAAASAGSDSVELVSIDLAAFSCSSRLLSSRFASRAVRGASTSPMHVLVLVHGVFLEKSREQREMLFSFFSKPIEKTESRNSFSLSSSRLSLSVRDSRSLDRSLEIRESGLFTRRRGAWRGLRTVLRASSGKGERENGENEGSNALSRSFAGSFALLLSFSLPPSSPRSAASPRPIESGSIQFVHSFYIIYNPLLEPELSSSC